MDFWIGALLGLLIGLMVGALLVAQLIQPRIRKLQAQFTALETSHAQIIAERDMARRAEAELAEVRKTHSSNTTEMTRLQNELATLRPMLNSANQEKERLLMEVIGLRAEKDRWERESKA